jgi:tetratricopeptide (TPR) repeat protein
MTKEDYEQAVDAYKRAFNLKNDRYDVVYSIAIAYAKQKKVDESINWLKKLTEKGYKDWKRLETDTGLNNIRASSEYKNLINQLKGS